MYFYLCEKSDKKAVITDLATAYLGFNSFTPFTPIHPGVNRDHPFRAVVSKTTFRAKKLLRNQELFLLYCIIEEKQDLIKRQ